MVMVPPPPPPIAPPLVRLQPSNSMANTYPNHPPCPALYAPCLPPLQPISVLRPSPAGIPGLVSHAQIPPHLGAMGPSAGVFASMNSWTDNPANQRPYFPVTVFSQPPTSKLSTTNTAIIPPCPPLSSQHAPYLTTPAPRSPTPPSHETTSEETITTQEHSHRLKPLLSSSTAPNNPHTIRLPERRSSSSPPPPPSRKSSRIGNRSDSYTISDSYSYSEDKAFSSTPKHLNKKRSRKSPVGRIRRKASPSNDDDTADEPLDYSGKKRTKRGDFYSSSSDSDSGGSCFSDQGPTQGSTQKNRKRREDSRSNGSKGNDSKSGGKSGGKSVPMLFPVGEGCLESTGSLLQTEATASVRRLDLEEPMTRKKHGPLTEESSHVVGESSMGRNFVVSLTSNYDISTGVEGTAYREDVSSTPASRPPPLDSRPDREQNKTGWEKRDNCSNWMDEIVERTVHTFTNKVLKLSSAAAF